MRERLSEISMAVWVTIIALVVIAMITFGGLYIQKYAYPYWLSVQRRAVEQSKSFTDANNNMLETYKLEHVRLDTKIAETGGNEELASAYRSQQKAIIGMMCLEISTMQRETVNPQTLRWLEQQGGCQ